MKSRNDLFPPPTKEDTEDLLLLLQRHSLAAMDFHSLRRDKRTERALDALLRISYLANRWPGGDALDRVTAYLARVERSEELRGRDERDRKAGRVPEERASAPVVALDPRT